MSAAGLEIDGVSVRYGETVAVSEASFHVAPGQAVGIVGANGAGKSSLLTAIAGLAPVGDGRVRVDGEPLPGRAWKVARTGVRLVTEERNLFASLSVSEHLQLAGRRLPRGERRSAVARSLGVFPALEPIGDRKAGLLSGGERSMLAIARAIVERPRLLLLDEPTLGLSPLATGQLIDSLRRISDDGVTILLSEQALRLPRAVCDAMVVMKLGGIVDQGPTASVLSSDALADSVM